MGKMYITVEEAAEFLGIAKSTSYNLLRKMNKELKEKNYITVAGKVNRKYFMERVYGMGEEV